MFCFVFFRDLDWWLSCGFFLPWNNCSCYTSLGLSSFYLKRLFIEWVDYVVENIKSRAVFFGLQDIRTHRLTPNAISNEQDSESFWSIVSVTNSIIHHFKLTISVNWRLQYPSFLVNPKFGNTFHDFVWITLWLIIWTSQKRHHKNDIT